MCIIRRPLKALTATLILTCNKFDWDGLRWLVPPESAPWDLKYHFFFPLEERVWYKDILVLTLEVSIKYNSQRQRQLYGQNPRNYVDKHPDLIYQILDLILPSLTWKCGVGKGVNTS